MQLEVGSILEGKVTGITKFGAFVELPGGKTGMVHISEIAPTFVKEIRDFVTENQTVKVKALDPSQQQPQRREQRPGNGPRQPRQPRQSRPAAVSPGRPGNYEWQSRRIEGGSFEDMMSRFKQSSDEKMSDLKRAVESKRGGFSRHNNSRG